MLNIVKMVILPLLLQEESEGDDYEGEDEEVEEEDDGLDEEDDEEEDTGKSEGNFIMLICFLDKCG